VSTAKTSRPKKSGPTQKRAAKRVTPKKAMAKTASGDTIDSLMKKALDGDATAMAALKDRPAERIDEYVLETYGELGRTVENSLIKKVTGDNLLHGQGIQLKAKQLKAELAGPDPSPLERLLVERVVCCWIMVNYADAMYIQDDGSRTWTADEHLQKWQDRAQKRFLSASKALAQIPRLLGPNIQINVGDKQVNIMPADA